MGDMISCFLGNLHEYDRGWFQSRACKQHAASGHTAAGADHCDLRAAGNLPLASLTPQLHSGLVDEPVAVQATAGELTAVGVEG